MSCFCLSRQCVCERARNVPDRPRCPPFLQTVEDSDAPVRIKSSQSADLMKSRIIQSATVGGDAPLEVCLPAPPSRLYRSVHLPSPPYPAQRPKIADLRALGADAASSAPSNLQNDIIPLAPSTTHSIKSNQIQQHHTTSHATPTPTTRHRSCLCPQPTRRDHSTAPCCANRDSSPPTISGSMRSGGRGMRFGSTRGRRRSGGCRS